VIQVVRKLASAAMPFATGRPTSLNPLRECWSNQRRQQCTAT